MKVRRTQAPVGYRFPVGHLTAAVCDRMRTSRHQNEALEQEIASAFGVRCALAVSSGKAALTLILTALKRMTGRRKVIIPAYTCYSLPSAILKADLEVVACDVSKDSFDYDFDRLSSLLRDDVLCVVSVHLFGIPSDSVRTREMCAARGIFVIDDAAQAMGGGDRGALLGTQGDAGFFSLGRGKNVTCGSGGLVVTDSPQIAAQLGTLRRTLPSTPATDDLRTLATLLLLNTFISPRLYWFPSGLPFLKLGETIFHEHFPVRAMSGFQGLLLRGWQQTMAQLNDVRREHGRFYLEHVDGARNYGADIPYLRFPVTVDGPDTKRRLLVDQNGAALGLNGMYPTTVSGIPQLAGRLAAQDFPAAERLASTLITLPTHPMLSEDDRTGVCALVNQRFSDRLTLSHPVRAAW